MSTHDQEKLSYLLIAAIPTPNGRLHLGHVSGPFLKLDIIKRLNRQLGNDVFLCSGTDCYESNVLTTAYLQKKSIEEICLYYHDQILADLSTLLIDIDLFLNPLAVRYKNNLKEIIQKHKANLGNKGHIVELKEQYPFSSYYGFLPPSFIAGSCSNCLQNTSGFICESCGFIYKAEEINNLHCRIGPPITDFKKISSLFLKINKPLLLNALSKSYIPADAQELVKNYLINNDYVRLTLPINWGIAASHHRVYYSYSSVFSYYELIRQQYNKALSTDKIKTVVSFGFDNTLTFLLENLNQTLELGLLPTE